ncbi:MAG: hypothetical protein RLZZ624_832 [Cyanobacteriota bacterium]|jgi:hypothetical protein
MRQILPSRPFGCPGVSRRLPLALAAAVAMALPAIAPARAGCQFLQPIGGDGVSPIITKTVGPGKVFGRTNWNTDFVVNGFYSTYKFFFTANSSDPNATYPVEGYLKFSDGSNLQVINVSMNPPIGTGRMFGPFPAIPEKTVSQLNFKVGASSDPGALGFTYRISVQGCN